MVEDSIDALRAQVEALQDAAEAKPSQAIAGAASSTNREAMEAVASLAARAAQLEEHMNSSANQAPGPPPGMAEMKMAHLESRFNVLSEDVEVLRRQRLADEMVPPAIQPAQGDQTPEGARIQALEGRVATLVDELERVRKQVRTTQVSSLGALNSGAEAEGQSSVAAAKLMELDFTVQEVVNSIKDIRDGRMQDLARELQALRDTVQRKAASSTSPAAARQAEKMKNSLTENAINELDRRNEERLAQAWTEIKDHSEAVNARTDQLEQSLRIRVDKVEKSITNFLAVSPPGRRVEQSAKPSDYNRQIEWLNWRISWLEWATGGEKRSFARPLDEKLLSPPPATPAAVGFAQPMTEDAELWARDNTGKTRLRRKITQPPRTSDGTRPGLAQDAVRHNLKVVRSTGKLPSLSQ